MQERYGTYSLLEQRESSIRASGILRTGILAIVALAVLVVTAHANSSLQLAVDIDSEALPTRVVATVSGGVEPFNWTILVETDFEAAQRNETTSEERTQVLILPSNRFYDVTILVQDADGSTGEECLRVGYRIIPGQTFVLDATRYAGVSGDSQWTQVDSSSEQAYVTTSLVSLRSTEEGKVAAEAEWPGRYVFSASNIAENVNVIISPSSQDTLSVRGMCEDYDPRPLGFAEMDRHLERMQRDGINAIQFIKTFKMRDITGTEIYDGSPFPYWDQLLAEAIHTAKEAGFVVMLRLVYFLDAEWPMCDDLMNKLDPRDWSVWFDGFQRIVLEYGTFAEEHGVDIYEFAGSLHTTYPFEGRYRSLIAQLRDLYGGKLVVTTGPWREGGLDTVLFWDALDYIGIVGSLLTMGSGAAYDDAIQKSIDDVYANYRKQFVRDVLPVAEQYGKRVLWSEVFYSSVVGSTYSPSGVPNWGAAENSLQLAEMIEESYTPETSFAEQYKGYEAMLRVAQEWEDWFEGIFALQWRLQPANYLECCQAGTHSIPFTPSEELFDVWWDQTDDEPESIILDGHRTEMFEQFPQPTGFYMLDGEGGEWRYEEQDNLDELRPIRFEYAISEEAFFRLRYTFNEENDLSAYIGIVLAITSSNEAQFRAEISTDGWNPAFSPVLRLQEGPNLIRIPFDEFVMEIEEGHSSLTTVLPAIDSVDAICIWPEPSMGNLLIYGFGVYR